MIPRPIKLLFVVLIVLAAVLTIALLFGYIPNDDLLLGLAGLGLGFSLSILFLLTLVVIAWIFAEAAINRRRVAALLAYLEQAVRLNLPLPRMMRAFAESEGRSLSARVRLATVALEQGEPLAVALEFVQKMPPRIIGLVAAAERVGRLPQVLARLMQQRRARVVRGIAWIPFYRTYPLILAAGFVGVTTMLLVFVMPKFQAIYHDFHIQLPWITRATLNVAGACSPWLPLLLIILLLACVCWTMWARWTYSGFGPPEGAGSWILNRLPWIGTVRMQGALGEALDFCAEALEGGRSIENSLYESAAIAPNPVARRKLRAWADELSRGQSLPAAARSAGLPRLIAGMTATATQSTDLAEMLRFLGRYYASRFSRAMAILQGIYIPAIVFFMGSLVAWLALSIFLPMIEMVNLLAAPKLRM